MNRLEWSLEKSMAFGDLIKELKWVFGVCPQKHSLTLLHLEEQNMENLKEKVSNLKRVICFWHKISDFTKYVQKLKMTENEKEEAVYLFKQIGICRNASQVNNTIEKLCTMNKDIQNYLLNNIIPKPEFTSKAFLGKIFTCGYVTSSISESANSMLKSYVSTQTVDFISMHKAVDKLYEQREANQSYI